MRCWLAVQSYGLLVALQIAVLNPLAAVPGEALTLIYVDAASAGQPIRRGRLFMAVGPGIAVVTAFWTTQGL